jgi:hypothetical protein
MRAVLPQEARKAKEEQKHKPADEAYSPQFSGD